MAVIPDKRADKVSFFRAHNTPWAASAVQIGTTQQAVTDLDTKTTAAQDKLDAQAAAHQAAKAATLAANDAIDAMVNAGADIIKAIRAKAAVDGNSVYELAEIPAPASPSPVNTLGQPEKFTVELGQDGALTLKWKCASPRASGTTYQVWRSLDGGANFAYLGGCGAKSYTDRTVPGGCASILYRVQATRSTASGPWATFMVLYGVSPAGQITASVAQPRIAA